MRYYLSIEKNVDIFEKYKALWAKHGVTGIRADSMAEGIEKAIEIESSKLNELYFIDIVADDIYFMTSLKILNDETDAPILIATSNPDDDEHHEALNNGADFYGKYCDNPKQDVDGVIAVINSLERRLKKRKPPSETIICDGIILAPAYRNRICINDMEIVLTKTEYDLLYLLMANRGKTLSHKQIYKEVWDAEFDEAAKNAVWATVGRLRDSLQPASKGKQYIQTIQGSGYCFPLMTVDNN